MRSLLKNKKGDVQSIIVMIVVVAVLAIIMIIFAKGYLDVLGELKTQEEFSNNTRETIELVESKTIPLLDLMIFMFLIGLMIALIISSIYIRVHPALTILFVLVLIIAIFLAGQFSNVYAEITDQPELSPTAAEFSKTNIILGRYFPAIILVTGIIVIIILYGKSGKVEGA